MFADALQAGLEAAAEGEARRETRSTRRGPEGQTRSGKRARPGTSKEADQRSANTGGRSAGVGRGTAGASGSGAAAGRPEARREAERMPAGREAGQRQDKRPVESSRERPRPEATAGPSGTSSAPLENYRILRRIAPALEDREPAAKKRKEGKKKQSRNVSRGKKEKERKERRRKNGKGDKEKKKRKRRGSSSSSSESSRSSSSSGSSSSQSSDSSSSSSDPDSESSERSSEEDRRKKKRKTMSKEDWLTSVEVWPLDERPEHLRSRRGAAGRRSLDQLLAIGDRLDKRAERMGAGKAVFAKDPKLKKVKYKKFEDNGSSRLHPARFNPLPYGDPVTWAREVPVKREQVLKNLYMANYGVEGQWDAKLVVKLHDRRVSVSLDELCRGSSLRTGTDMGEVWRLKAAAWNYVTLMHKLWPTEAAALIIYKTLEDSRWAAVAGEDKRLRANMIRQFFNETVDENAGRAVIRGMSLTALEAKAKWLRMVEREFPQTSAMNSGIRLAGGAGGGAEKMSGPGKKKWGSGGGAAGGNSTAGPAAGGQASGSGGGQGKSGGQPRAAGQAFIIPIPRFNGLSLCWAFNKGGCTRPAHTPTSCKEANSPSIFAHVCNHWDPVARKHCYGSHGRMDPGRH